MAVSLDVGVPWIMCQQADAPPPTVSITNLSQFVLMAMLLFNKFLEIEFSQGHTKHNNY